MDLSKKIFGANVSKEIRDYFKGLQEGNFKIEPGDSVKLSNNTGIGFSSDTDTYLGDRTPYARMWVAVNKREELKKNIAGPPLPGGGMNYGKSYIYTINENREGSYNKNELDSLSSEMRNITETGFNVNYRPQLDNNPYMKPTAGITSINSKSEGAVGALRRTNVDFIVHNKQDFENIVLPFFLKPGATVFVDFGWSDKALSLYNPESIIENENPSMGNFYKKIFKGDGEIGKGFKTTLSGQVVKYDVNVDEKGSFNCNLEFVSSNYALLDKSVSDDNKLKYIFENNIEDILMTYYLNTTKKELGTSIYKEYFGNKSDVLTTTQKKQLVNDFFDKDITPDLNYMGIIDPYSVKSGVFFQNLTSNAENKESVLDSKESLYISYGLFEDLFLNNFISFWVTTDDKGDDEQKIKSDEEFSNSFSSKNSYVRYDFDLFDMQKQPFRDADERTSFLYPDNWDVTYNKFNPNDNSTDDDKKQRRIPLRDLFISVPLISEAFKKSNIVNDALEYIFDTIYEESATIINIKMIPNNDAQTSITFQDINVEAGKFGTDDELPLKFDLTSGNAIVLNSDLKFETPKAGLSSMIAIGNMDNDNIFDEMELMKFNFLNALSGEDKKIRVQHLPIYGKTPSVRKSLDIDMKRFMMNVDAFPQPGALDRKIDLTKFVNDRLDAIDAYYAKTDSDSSDTDEPDPVTYTRREKNKLGQVILYASSEREVSFLNAKINNFIKTDNHSISPVMPISLTLKVYGNNFLGIGDFFTVNFLPKHYEERVYFQIMGVDHNMGTSMWDTTYTTVMRLKSTEKYKTSKNTNAATIGAVVELDELFIKQKANESHTADDKSINKLIDLLTVKIDLLGNVKFNPNTKDLSSLTINFERHILNSKRNKIKINQKLKDKNESKFMSKTTFVTGITPPEIYDEGKLSAITIISNLLLSEDVINWKKVVEDNNAPKFEQPLFVDYVVKKTITARKAFDVHITSRETSSSKSHKLPVALLYKEFFKFWDNKEKFYFNDLDYGNDITFDENEKAADDILTGTTQKLSGNIKDSEHLIGFRFIDAIIWPIIDEEDNHFIKINFDGNSDFNVFKDIFIPEKYVNEEILSNSQTFVNKLAKEYEELKLKLSEGKYINVLTENFK